MVVMLVGIVAQRVAVALHLRHADDDLCLLDVGDGTVAAVAVHHRGFVYIISEARGHRLHGVVTRQICFLGVPGVDIAVEDKLCAGEAVID